MDKLVLAIHQCPGQGTWLWTRIWDLTVGFEHRKPHGSLVLAPSRQQRLGMPPGVAMAAASSGFGFSSPHHRVMSATTLSCGTIVGGALGCV